MKGPLLCLYGLIARMAPEGQGVPDMDLQAFLGTPLWRLLGGGEVDWETDLSHF